MAHPPNIALTPQTDERNFPVWKKDAPPGFSGHPWPRMMVRPVTEEDIRDWRAKNLRRDPNTNREYFEDRPPKKGDPIPVLVNQDLVDAGLAPVVGEPVICTSPDHEDRVMKVLVSTNEPGTPEETPDTFSIPTGDPAAKLERLQRENDELRKKLLTVPSVSLPPQAKSRSRSRSKSPAKASLEEFSAS